MDLSLQEFLITLLVGLAIGGIVGYFLRQGRISELQQALKQNQKRTEDLEYEHEQRLQNATLQLQKDYEAQLAEKIERYQDQLEEKTTLLEQEYQGRLAVLDQGRQSETLSQLPAESPASSSSPDIAPDLQYIEQQVKRQYEDRLKEAARKIQQAYEQHLRQKLKESRDFLQRDYENRLSQKIEHYEAEVSNRISQLQEEYELRAQALASSSQPVAPNPTPPQTPVQGNWETTMTMAPLQPQMVVPVVPAAPIPEVSDEKLLELENRLRDEYDQKLAERIERYQDALAQRIQTLEDEYEGRFQAPEQTAAPAAPAAPLADTDLGSIEESLRQEYEQKLAEKIEHYQDDLSQRVTAIAEEYETRFQVLQQAQPDVDPHLETESAESNINVFDLSDLTAEPDPDPAPNPFPSKIEAQPSSQQNEPSSLANDPFSLEDLLLTAEASATTHQIDLEDELGTDNFSLDELLFEETDEEPLGDDSDLDDISRLT